MIIREREKTLCEKCFADCYYIGKYNNNWDKHNICTGFMSQRDIENKAQEDEEDEITQITIDPKYIYPFGR